jgi:hydroxymethylpyrimidine kinase/phosphomethylpyrimidine kinase/thiamine-phosphate diphosphorylase
MRPAFDLSVYLVLDPGLCAQTGLVETAVAAAGAGATMVQLRDKTAPASELIAAGHALKRALAGTGALLVVNDSVEAAIAIGADGLHVGQDDMSAAAARALIGPDMILGLTAETEELVSALDPNVVDYAGLGPVFATPSKPGHKRPIGMAGLARLVAACPVPAVAIGGLKAAHAAAVFEAGRTGNGGRLRHLRHARSRRGDRGDRRSHRKGPDMIRNVLSIAGSDPSGGAGIQADLKAFSARGVYGMAVLTALTAQNTRGVSGVHVVPPAFVAGQIEAIFADVRVDAVKIGMIATAGIAEAVADALAPHAAGMPVVLDPVMVAKGGASLLDPDAVAALRRRLMPMATVVTPNLPEAAALLDAPVTATRDEMAAQARRLVDLGASAVLLKGGHLNEPQSPDVLATRTDIVWLEADRTPTANTHGTGCTLSSALAAELAGGAPLAEAARTAKSFLTGAIAAAGRLSVGCGHGPVHHFHELWQPQQERKFS